MIDRDISLALLGAGIALFSSLATSILQHFLSLRAERKRIEWQREENKHKQIQEALLRGVTKASSVHFEEGDRYSGKRGDIDSSVMGNMFGGVRVEDIDSEMEIKEGKDEISSE